MNRINKIITASDLKNTIGRLRYEFNDHLDSLEDELDTLQKKFDNYDFIEELKEFININKHYDVLSNEVIYVDEMCEFIQQFQGGAE